MKFSSHSYAVTLSEEENPGSHINVVITSLEGLDGSGSVCPH